ncbi:MAG: uroporphyrinogen decarboxylase family protein [Armatimonadetes bacterium]|nr:uroporphyrinogen decarboxylase family protein [Armatimonadota bacterium]
MGLTSKERMMRALKREIPDRLPVAVHQWQGYHLNHYLGGISDLEAFKAFGMDAAIQYFESMGQFWLPGVPEMPQTPDWKVEIDVVKNTLTHRILKYRVSTPKGELTYATEGNEQTTWLTEHIIKRPEDIEKLAYMPVSKLDKIKIADAYDKIGDAGIMRGFVWGDQAGSWQHACCLAGTQEMIMYAMDDPEWTHALLKLLNDKKLLFIEESLDGASFDVIETGGGAASSTVISPKLYEEFCLPCDTAIHEALHSVGHISSYHTCGGMVGILDLIAANKTDASETLSPPGVGGNITDRMTVKNTLGKKCCLIGGMDQFNVLTSGTPERIKQEVRDLFSTYGVGGGYIMSTADHFFDVPVENLKAYAGAAHECVY